MTLSMSFISRMCSLVTTPKAAIVLVTLLVVQGCSTLPQTKTQAPKDLNALGNDIVDMVNVSVGEQSSDNRLAAANSAVSNKSLYLEQARQKLADVPAQVITQFNDALALMQKKQWPAAKQLLDKILAVQPHLSSAYVNKALIAVHQKEHDLAITLLDKALAVNPINPYAHQIKAGIARFNGQFEQAEKSYLKALAAWPDYPEAQINLAVLLELYRGRLLDARQYYLSYLKLKPDDEQAKRWLAGVEIKIRRAGLTLPEKTQSDSSSSVSKKVTGE